MWETLARLGENKVEKQERKGRTISAKNRTKEGHEHHYNTHRSARIKNAAQKHYRAARGAVKRQKNKMGWYLHDSPAPVELHLSFT